ncbi:MAG TPA: hypothetical protein VN673_14405 [Clostridia bacterium]|nr:hypothetical protein [Clostridia bacterium]
MPRENPGAVCLVMSFAAQLGNQSPLFASRGKGATEALVALVFALLFPFICAGMNFVFGLLAALRYNLLAGWIGRIEVEVE